MDYKKISNELLFTYHKNIDFVYKVLGEFLYNTQNFNRKYSKSYKTSEGKVFVSWDKSNDWSLKLNESVSRSDIKLSIKESNEYQPVDAYPGDYVDFGPYGKLYICNDLGDRYWVTDEESDAGNPNAQGWYIDKDLARDIIYSDDDFEDEDFDIDESFSDDLIDSQYQDDTSDGHWSWDYDDDELANIYGGDTKYDNHPDGIDIDEYDLMEIDNYNSQFEECLFESDKTHTFVTPEGKELKSSHFVKLFKDAVKTGAWHKKFGKQSELTRVEIENANKRENRLRMQLAELFGYSQEEIDALEEEALSEPIIVDYLEESQNTGLHEGNSITEDTSDRTSTDFSWSKGWCDCGAKDVFPHMLFATDAGTVFREGPYGYRLRGEVFAENPNIFHAYVMKYTDNSEYASHGQGGKTVVGKENLDSLEAAKAFIEDWFTNSFDSYVNKRNESLTEGLSPKEGDRVRMDHYSKLNNGQEGTITGRIGELCWVTWDDGTKSKEIKGYLTVIERDGTVVNESATDPRYYKMVEYTYDGDNVSDYLGHVRVRTNSDKVALRAAEKYAMNKHPEYNPRHFKIVDYNYTNVDVVDSDGDYLTTLESVDESKSIKEGIEIDTIADYITDHYDFDDIDDKYNCINSIKDSFKNEKTISKEELEQFIGSHNGKDKVTEGIDGWDNRTGVIKRIDKYLYDNPEAIPPKGYIQPGSRAYDDAVSRYGDYVTTPFGNISTDDLMQYARDNKLLDESKYTSSLIGPDSLLMNAEEAYFDGNLGDFVADSLNDGSATEEELLAVTEKSSFIEYDDMLNAIDYAKSLSSF